MAKPLLLSIGNGKVQELVGTANNDIPTWNSTTSEWVSTSGGGGGSGTVTSVGLTGGTSGIVIGGTTSPITTSGTYNLDAPLRFAFNTTTPTAVAAAGQVSWNDTEGSLASMLKGNGVTALLGQQVYQRATNVDTDPLTKGMVVYVFGSSGTRISVKRALADADLSSAAILGVVAEEIAVNGTGFIMTSGLIKDLSVLKPADGFADGIVVYLSPTTAGALTATKPEAPNHLVTVGYVAKASAGEAGELLVHTQNGYELGELHDVYVNSPTSGQILIYDATSGQTRWENASLTGGTGVTVTSGPGSLSVAIGQSVATGASPSFAGLTLSSLSVAGFVKNSAAGVLSGGNSVSLTADVSGQLPLANGGTNANLTAVNGGAVYSTGSALAVTAAGTSGQFLKSNGASAPTWADVTAPAQPYDFASRFVGTPVASRILAEWVADRAVTLATSGWQFWCVNRPGTTTTNLLIKKNGSLIATYQFTTTATFTNSRYLGVLSGSITATSLAAGDFLTVESDTTVDAAFSTPIFSILGTA